MRSNDKSSYMWKFPIEFTANRKDGTVCAHLQKKANVCEVERTKAGSAVWRDEHSNRHRHLGTGESEIEVLN